MIIKHEKMDLKHQAGVMSIFNHYIKSGTAAFPANELPESFYPMILKKSEGYPAYVLLADDRVIGFCSLSPYNPFPTFKPTAMVSYFLDEKHVGMGLGQYCLELLIAGAVEKGVSQLIAEISSENTESIKFHYKNGFELAGELKAVGLKNGQQFGVVLMQKNI